MNVLKGFRTYLVAALGIVLNGLAAMGYIDPGVITTVNKILAFIGLATVRNAIS